MNKTSMGICTSNLWDKAKQKKGGLLRNGRIICRPPETNGHPKGVAVQTVDKVGILSSRTSDRCHWCGDPHSKSLENTAFLKKNGLPRQCAHWLAMTWFGVCLQLERSPQRGGRFVSVGAVGLERLDLSCWPPIEAAQRAASRAERSVQWSKIVNRCEGTWYTVLW